MHKDHRAISDLLLHVVLANFLHWKEIILYHLFKN